MAVKKGSAKATSTAKKAKKPAVQKTLSAAKKTTSGKKAAVKKAPKKVAAKSTVSESICKESICKESCSSQQKSHCCARTL